MPLLSINFPMTFFCERQSISKILELAKNKYFGTVQEISLVTGIPSGKSSGKVKPHIDYALGMGLIDSIHEKGVYQLSLTPFGSIVYESDLMLNEPITQWLAHANLCDPVDGASLWTEIFTNWTTNDNRSTDLISSIAGIQKSKVRPLIQMYERAESFGRIGVLRKLDEGYSRTPAMISHEWNRAFGALIINSIERHFHKDDRKQISIPELVQVTQLPARFHWQSEDFNRVIQNLTSLGLMKFSNLVDPPVVQSLVPSEQIWATIYDDIV
nr:hypothetical protein [uncultured Sphaerochaeta sp.]